MDNIWWNNNKIITIDNVKEKSVIMIAYLYIVRCFRDRMVLWSDFYNLNVC